jgi:hypothetical protein
VNQLWFSSKPGGVMLPPELDELTPFGLLLRSLKCKQIDREIHWGGSNRGDKPPELTL